MTFKPGDIVLLKSGGPSMTVVSVDDDEISCVWIGDEGELFRGTLPPVALDLIEADSDEDESDDNDDDDDDDDEDEDDDEHGHDDEDEDAEADEDERVEPDEGRLRRVGKK